MFRIEIENKIDPDKITEELAKQATIPEKKLVNISNEIKKGIEANINAGIGWNGSPLMPLKPTTIRNKKSSKLLVESGELLRSIMNRKVSSNIYEIFVGLNRSEVAQMLINGTSKMVSRDFWGVSPEADKAIDKILSED